MENIENKTLGNIMCDEWLDNLRDFYQDSDNDSPKFGIKSLDEFIPRFFDGDVYLISGDTGTGRTALALQTALNVAQNKPVLFFSPAVRATDIANRFVAMGSDVPLYRLSTYHLTDGDWENIAVAAQDLYQSPMAQIVIDDNATDIKGVFERAVNFAETEKPELIVIDDIDFIEADPATASREAKKLALKMQCPVIITTTMVVDCTDSLSRVRPYLHKENNDIARYADVVMHLRLNRIENATGIFDNSYADAGVKIEKNRRLPQYSPYFEMRFAFAKCKFIEKEREDVSV